MANDRQYVGPWVPVHDMAGTIVVEGMTEADEVRIRLETEVRVDEKVFIGNGELSFEPKPGLKAQAERIRSSGREIFIWAS